LVVGLGIYFGAGALWYIHENNGAPVLGDKADLPTEIVTCGRDFPMEFLTESFQDTKMTVIRNVTTPGEREMLVAVAGIRIWCLHLRTYASARCPFKGEGGEASIA